MNVDEAITSRKSVRRFLPTPVPRATVEHILEVAARAPSGHNVQPWRVYALAGEPLAKLGAAVLHAAKTEADAHQPEYEYYPTKWVEPYIGRRRATGFGLYAALGIARDDAARREAQMLRNYTFFDAPAGLMVTLDRRLETGSFMDLGMFIQSIMIAARGQGLHTCAQAAFAWYHKIIRAHLPIADDELLTCGISLGYEDPSAPENAFITTREPVGAFTHFEGF
ncbi:MAG: nitroreductase [Burkholderiaceae bacterium]|jgi:nitroreductase